ncbi:hypothetical protein MASR2M15_01680 [Anaerolineales bacterium]
MSVVKEPYKKRPPVMSVRIEDTMDVMIVRDTTRRAASLIGFSPAFRAQLAGAASSLAELVLKTHDPHIIHLNGIINGLQNGLQISVDTPWLMGVSENNIKIALQSKMGELVDEIILLGEDPPAIFLVMWLTPEREI